MTSAQGTMGVEVPLLLGIESTVNSGALGVEVGATPAGVVATVSAGALTPVVAVALTGQTITASSGQFLPYLSGTTLTVSRGTITPTVSVMLTGHAMTVKSTSPGFIASDSTHVVVGLLGYTPTLAAGAITPAIAAGTAATTFTPSPAVTTNTSSTPAFNYGISHVRHQAPYVQGKYWFVGENEDGSGSDWQTCVISPASRDAYVYSLPDVRQFAFAVVPNWGFGGYTIADLNPKFNGLSYQTFTDSNLQYSGVPRKWGLGVLFGVGAEGNMAQLRCRTEDRFLTYPNRTRYLVYQEIREEIGYETGFATDKGVELAHDIDCSRFESSAAAEDGPVNHALGIVPLRPTRVRLREGGTDIGYFKVTNALIFHPSLWNDGTNDHWVPTYTKVSKDVNPSPTVQKITNDVQLRSWTGVSRLLAMSDTLVTTHSGYGDIAYLTYLSSTFATPRTPAYAGVIVMDLETQEVFAHTVKALAAAATPLTTEDLTFQEEFPHRAMSEAIRLSNGRSVTQFAIRGFVVNLQWTEGTKRNPTITMKDGPSTGTICTGADFLETRGDTVYHVMMRGNSALPTSFRTVYNDATSTSASWTVPSSDLWSWSLTFSGGTKAAQFYSGSHKGKQTFFAETIYDTATNNLDVATKRSGEAWIDFWSGQNPILSVAAEGHVGFVDPVITDCGVSVQLTGHQLTVYQSNGLISGENKTVALTGHQINANYTCPTAVTNVVVPLVGHGMECAPGRMTLIGDPVDVKLTGAHICAQMNTPSTLPPGTVQLSGFGVTVSPGTLVPHINITLSGFGMTCSQGVIDASAPLMSGLQITASGGTLKPAISVGLMGQAATAASGTMVANPGATLPGQSATASVGTLVPHVTVALSGHSMTASAGTITPTCGVTLGGQAATCSKGNMTPDISVRVTSTAIVMSTGTVVPLHTVNLASNALTASKGNFVVFMSRALSGQVATMQIGTMGLSYDCNFAITGVQATGYTGLLRTNLPTPPADANLFVSDDNVEELFAVASQLGT